MVEEERKKKKEEGRGREEGSVYVGGGYVNIYISLRIPPSISLYLPLSPSTLLHSLYHNTIIIIHPLSSPGDLRPPGRPPGSEYFGECGWILQSALLRNTPLFISSSSIYFLIHPPFPSPFLYQYSFWSMQCIRGASPPIPPS